MKIWNSITKMSGLDLAVKLPREYDAERLQKELTELNKQYNPVLHFSDTHDGGWNAISLVSRGGSVEEADLKGDEPYRETEALKMAPYFKELLDSIPCEKHRCRILGLEPGKKIFWHFDAAESIDYNRVRIHVPIITNEKVDFWLGHTRWAWKPGELWYGDFSFPHYIHNRSDQRRVHLVMDVLISDELMEWFPKGYLQLKNKRAKYRNLANKSMQYSHLLLSKIGINSLIKTA
jgi:hypothetical protein